jgi:hypothetical protein
MTEYNLTAQQRELLKTIVDQLKSGKGQEPLIPVVTNSGGHIIGFQENFGQNLLGDLEVLNEADLLGSRYNSGGDKIFTVKQSAYDAVKNKFVISETQVPTQVNIGAIIRDMNGGNIQAVGFSNNSELNQLVNDSDLLDKKLDELSEQLVDVVKSELSPKELMRYLQTIEELKEEIKSQTPSPSFLQKIFSSISFLGDLEGTISLATRVLPYIYQFMLIASQKLSGGANNS